VFCILDQLRDAGCFYLGFTGGEPFIRHDIMDILWYAKRLGFEIIIYTNGSLLTKKMVGELSDIRPNKIDITIPGMSKEAFERISKVAGSRDKVFQAIDLLHKEGIDLGFKACLLKENKSEISEMRKFAVSLGARIRFDDIFFPRLDGSLEPFKQRAANDGVNGDSLGGIPKGSGDCLEHRLVSRQRLSNKTTSADKDGHLFKCGVGINQAAINPQGELKMCVMINYPNYKIPIAGKPSQKFGPGRSGLENLWQRLQHLVMEIDPDENYQCDSCEVYDFCKWCPARSWIRYKNFCRCAPENREWAIVKSQQIGTLNNARTAGCIS
jgi:radical SAM protein with 4Fe4S-binding SPASM domain